MIKAFVNLRLDSVASQNAFTYDVGLWDDSTELPISPAGWTESVAMGTTIVAPYTNKRIHDAIVAAIIAKALSDFTITLTEANMVFLWEPQQSAEGAKAYDGTTSRANAFPIFKSGTVSGGNVVVHLTDNGASNGNALFPTGVILDSIQARAEEGTTPHAFGTAALSNSNKTLTLPVSKIAPILGILNLNQAANGSVIKLAIWGY